MSTAFKARSPLCFLASLHLVSSKNLKWVSSKSAKSSPHLLEDLRLLFNGRRNRSRLDYELSIVSALKSCASFSALSPGQQIHGLVLKSGLDFNMFVQNSLINLYAKCELISDARSLFDSFDVLDSVSCNIMIAGYVRAGRLGDARKMFDVMPRNGCVPYTTMIMGLAQNDRWTEAIEVFKDMRSAVVLPNEVTMSSVISAYAHCGGGQHCRMLHGLVLKLALEFFVLISTNLVHMYCTSSCLRDARILFNDMPEKNTVSWNVMLNGYAKSGLVDVASNFFEMIPDKDVVSWGTVIDSYVQVGWLCEALMMFRAMLRTGLVPNEVMIVDIISSCGQSMAIFEGQQFHCITIKTGFDLYDFMQATVIHFYAACNKIDLARLQFELGSKDHLSSWNAFIGGLIRNGMIDEARYMFNKMPERDVFSWSTMISGYSQTEQPDLALELFHTMVGCDVKPNEVTMMSVLSAIAALGVLKEGKWAHDYICNNSIALNDNLSAAIIDMYSKCGSISTALEVFHQIQEEATSVSPWNAIICGLAMHGHADLSLKIFSDLQRRNIKLNSITFIGVLGACCHAGLVEVGERHFKSMKSLYKIDPNIKHYGCMVDLLGRAGRLEEAEELVKSMPIKADVVIWGTILAASRTHGNMEIAERAAKSLARVESSHGGSRVLLSNIYADAGRWDDALSVRRAMQSQKLTKSPGYSEVV